jgi:carboxypeptidase family protein
MGGPTGAAADEGRRSSSTEVVTAILSRLASAEACHVGRSMNRCFPVLALFVWVTGAASSTGRPNAQAKIGSVSGRAVDWAGASMPGVSVQVHARGESLAAARKAITAGDGGFEFRGLAAGEYELQVFAPGSETATERVVRVDESRTTTLVVEAYRGCDTLADERGSLTAAAQSEAMRIAIENAVRIEEDPSILGLGDVQLMKREKSQPTGGRVDFVMYDPEQETRFEVEVMLGVLDESHIRA